DGSVSYQADLQRAIDAAAETGSPLVFPPMVYAVDETGLQLRSGLDLRLTGAMFRLDENRQQDGAVFLGRDVTDVSIRGGTIVGRNDAWADGVNIRGIYIAGKSARIRLCDLSIRDLTSNGIGIFGTEEAPIRDVWIRDVVIDNCCNRYPDYLSGEKWEKGSQREDQGLLACYFVEDFVAAGSRFERSRSDGTHFYRCRRGQFTDNKVYRAKMGGYFLEGCADVVAHGNLIRENGSRGVTIERGSTDCLLCDNVVTLSGREGLWAPDCVGLIVTGNIFNRNGRKPNGPERHYIWNANITINEARGDPSNSPTADYLVADNLIYTTADQIAAIRVDANETTSAIVLRANLLRGENRKILVEGVNAAEVVLDGNHSVEPLKDDDQPSGH
ncbi:MAG: right-handed parallel beta-helix repeat-containing protein, partial [Planctomycetes bacterium]|nr:right-handed parallel beta-helix repeat-containing protein [Planctomycetota bacterium]